MKDKKIQRYKDKFENKPLPHNFITKELIRRKFITDDSDFDLYLWDAIFDDLLQRYEFKVVLICTGYTISCIKRNHFKDEENKPIECLYAYFRVALQANIAKYLRPPVRLSWMDDD